MYKRLSLLLLAASARYVCGAAINGVADTTAAAPAAQAVDTTAQTAAAAAPAVDTTGAVGTGATTPATAFVPKYTEAEVAAAPNAPVYTQCVKPGQFVITFDDGPNPATTPIALKFLKEHNIQATFFINGANYSDLDTQPEALDLILQEHQDGHFIASHTYNHVDLFSALQQGTMEENIDRMSDKIEQVIGLRPAFFRPPEGKGGLPAATPDEQVMIDKIQKYLGASGTSIIMWGCDTRDWQYKDDLTQIFAELDKDLKKPGVSPATHSFISLMHDVHPTTVNTVLPAVVEYVTSLGYQIVPLTECLGVTSAYQAVAGDVSNNLNGSTTNSTTVAPTEEPAATTSAASIIEVKTLYSFIAIILAAFLLF
ncbi:glycoside hydrolase/deacetylase [Anaeromyces robustus]|jgi:peptidoglycan/xylan/chitin deacetylase (PgdA/CDA1 family)|uniref:Glycoside hydrolase/deacetylase n=1 Tax=Anaeromyces robustus TaxID=1754192 RepID=A0A1Y1XGM8_9FUNG|nr:glycoside hydrolase/deacetylase [Anaeromyces robustus]|eukprot:ORX84534.1 glycoside hydrolase/deacetylase [Anaeromyces robustus]